MRLQAPSWWGRESAYPLALTAPAILFVALFGLWPLAGFLFGSIQSAEGGLTTGHYQQLLSDRVFLQVAVRTTLVSAVAAAVTLALAYPLAYVLTKVRGAAKMILIVLVALPYLTSVLVRVYAWAALLALDGPVNRLLVALGILDAPQLLGHSLFGTLLGMLHILCPIAVLTLWSQMEKIDPAQKAVAASLGASSTRAFLTVFLPQCRPGLEAAGTIVYVLALGAYVIPAALGGTKGLMFAQLVVDQATQLLEWEVAGAMGVLMLAIAGIPVMLLRLAGTLRSRTDAAITPTQHLAARFLHPILDQVPPGIGRAAAASCAAAVLAFLVVPELVVVVFSFGPVQQVVLPPASLSLDSYRAVLSDAGWLDPARRSVIYAAADALVAVTLGTAAAYGFVRGPTGWARVGAAVLLAPLVLPEILVAISFFVFATKAHLAGTALGIILGQAVGTIGLVVVVLGAVIRGVDVELEHAAQACGASRLRTLRDVVLPLIAPGVIVAFVYAALHAFDNLVTPLFIAGTRATVTVRMFLSMQEQLTSAPAVIASILIFALVAGLGCALLVAVFGRRSVPLLTPERPTLAAGR